MYINLSLKGANQNRIKSTKWWDSKWLDKGICFEENASTQKIYHHIDQVHFWNFEHEHNK